MLCHCAADNRESRPGRPVPAAKGSQPRGRMIAQLLGPLPNGPEADTQPSGDLGMSQATGSEQPSTLQPTFFNLALSKFARAPHHRNDAKTRAGKEATYLKLNSAIKSNGSLSAETSRVAAFATAAASRLWSNAASRVPFTASTTMNSRAPAARSLRYQKRLLSSTQWGRIWSLRTSPGARIAPRRPRCWGEDHGSLRGGSRPALAALAGGSSGPAARAVASANEGIRSRMNAREAKSVRAITGLRIIVTGYQSSKGAYRRQVAGPPARTGRAIQGSS